MPLWWSNLSRPAAGGIHFAWAGRGHGRGLLDLEVSDAFEGALIFWG